MPGGVCAVLDYETDMMSDYVADMATRLVIPRTSVTPAFRKFVNQILTSTRLPSTTILLGMNYLAKHINMHKPAGTYDAVCEGEAWKMLTVALLLGSKFLDDNTFQNRSWSDVSGIAVAELNTMEGKWLQDMNWLLYVNVDRSHDYEAWLNSWKQYRDNKCHAIQQQQSQAALRERLAPIVTSIRTEASRQPHHPLSYEGWTPEEIVDQERLAMNGRNARTVKVSYRPREGSWPNRYQNPWAQAPLTPPDSGYGTPEYLNSAASVNSRYNEWFSQAVANQNYGRYTTHHNYSSSRGGSHFHQPYFGQYAGHTGWDAGVAECNCAQCLSAIHTKAGSYFHPHAFGQPVVG
ncbi:hypothetical protein RRF57_012835 [Xylaria bambusicola]|uniref:Cyclin N-terminal domain-containing protein n=1 Tax=Xylaria bambusicola TaxID=326684 RepID=A0AAN7UX99_9PEZI